MGRTGRAGKSGEALLLLAEEERPMLRILKDMPLLPISPTLLDQITTVTSRKPINLRDGFRNPTIKSEVESAFVSHLGSLNSFRGRMKWTDQFCVDFTKRYFQGLGMDRAPNIELKILRKMGMTKVKF